VAATGNGHSGGIVTPVTADTSTGGDVAAATPLRADPRPGRRAPGLRLAPPLRRRRRSYGDAVFATTLAALLAVGILGVLLLNTAMQTQADRIAATQHRLAGLNLAIQGAQTTLDRLNTPAELAARAIALHMRPAKGIAILRASAAVPTHLPGPVSERVRAKKPTRAG
jgi:hypothetical protein